MPFQRTGILLVLSAPSGAGKTTLRDALHESTDLDFAVSCTTRPPRPGEKDGKDYHFISEADFERRIQEGEFLEYATVHAHRYGTLKQPLLEPLQSGRDILLDIDTVGAATVRRCEDPVIRDALADVFLMPPPIQELRRRLKLRGTESEKEMETRLRNAEQEMKRWTEYRYVIEAGKIEETLEKFLSILKAERSLARRFYSQSNP